MSDLDVSAFVERQVDAVHRAIGDEKTLIAVSGGVDSTVSAVIARRAIGGNLVCVFIDDNFMRLGEPEAVKSILSSPPLSLPSEVLDERRRFMNALNGLADAEDKRKAFRETFYRALGDAARSAGCRFLVQGTIRADIEETKGGIKTQHNILEQIGIDSVERFGFRVVEPIASLYKYQVREIARHLGVPPEVSERQPFPGPGLSVRVVGRITEEKLDRLKVATAVVEAAFKGFKPSQYFAAITGGGHSNAPERLHAQAAAALGLDPSRVAARYFSEKGTGVVGGRRAYGSVVAIEATDEVDSPIDVGYAGLERMRATIQSRFPEVTRVLYMVDGRRDGEGCFIVMRAVETKDFITAGVSEIPWKNLRETAAKIIKNCPGMVKVYYDLTPKPPATIEFE